MVCAAGTRGIWIWSETGIEEVEAIGGTGTENFIRSRRLLPPESVGVYPGGEGDTEWQSGVPGR